MTPLQQGSQGADVAKLQTSLNAAGYSPGAIDSNFGPKTAAALSAYQTANGLKADSVFGPITAGKLYGTTPTTTITSSDGKSPLDLANLLDAKNPNLTPEQKVLAENTARNNEANYGSKPTVGTSDTARADALAKIKAEMNNGLTEPTAYNSSDTYNKLRTEKGVVQDENEMSTIQNEKAKLQEQLRVFDQTAGEGTSESGRIGMESEAQRNVQNKLDSLAIQETAVTNRLNTKNNYINTVLNLGKEDYTTALNKYNTAYNTNLKAIELYNTTLNNTQKDALTGFTTITNLLKDHNVSNIDATTKGTLDSLALQAGLPKGIFQAVIQATPNEKILAPQVVSNTDGTKDVYFYTQDKNGIPSLKTVQHIGSTSSPGKISKLSNFSKAFSPDMTDSKGGPILDQNKFVTPDAWKELISSYTGKRADFIKQYGNFLYKEDLSSYGLTPAEQKLITGVSPSSKGRSLTPQG